jgi:hypothetical protein
VASVTLAAAILVELGLGSLEDPGIDDRRDRNGDPLLRRRGDTARASRQALAPAGAQGGLGRWRNAAQPPEHGLAAIRRIAHHARDAGRVPIGQAGGRQHSRVLQPPTDLAQAEAVQSDPGEHEPHVGRLLGHDLDPGDPAALALGHITIAERCPTKRTHGTHLRRMAAPTPAAFQDLGAFVFSNHALELQKQIILRGDADRPVQEHDFGSGAAELLNKEHLISIAPSQAVRGLDVKAIEAAHGDRVAQPLKSRTQ